MGKLGRTFGLAEKGKIGITVDKQSFVAGEVVCGTIFIEVYEPIECNGKKSVVQRTFLTTSRLTNNLMQR